MPATPACYFLSVKKLDPEMWVAVSPAKEIGAEYRFIVQQEYMYSSPQEGKYKIVSGACYITKDEKKVQPFQYRENRLEPKHPAYQAAVDVLKQCDRYLRFAEEVFVMDLCWDRESQSYKILELNPFWSAGLYGGDPSAIIKQIGSIFEEI
jgi:hypothetical protein